VKAPHTSPKRKGQGQVGNFSIVGHRWGSHGLSYDLPKLRKGDVITVETAHDVSTYKVTGSETVLPANTGPIAPVPDHWGQTPTKATITLITCTPLYISTHRLAVHSELIFDQAKS